MVEIGNSIAGGPGRERPELAEARQYWLEALSGEPKPAAIRAGIADSRADRRFASVPLPWPETLAPKLLGLARDEDTLLNAILTAGLAVVVYKYGGDADFVLCSPPYAGAFGDAADSRAAAGNDVLPIRCRLRAEATVKELLKETNRTLADAYRYQDYPVREALGVRGGGARWDAVGCELANIHDRRTLLGRRSGGTNEISVSAARKGDSLAGELAYDASLLDRRGALTLADAYVHVLEQMADDPAAPVSSLELLRAPMRARMLDAFCRSGGEAVEPVPMHRLFEEMAAAAPQRPAVNGGGLRLTYGELNERANALAGRIRREGAPDGGIVGIMLERSVELATAVLAVLKAGCAYLPLDPGYPEARLRHMAEDSGMAMLLTHAGLAGRLAYAGKTVLLDGGTSLAAAPPAVAPAAAPNGGGGDGEDAERHGGSSLRSGNDRPAYVIYTSGSTGTPKGVAVGHRGMAALRDLFRRELAITENDRIVQFASASFDASVWELAMALFTGAELYLPPPETMDSFERFADYLNRSGITVATLPPTFAAHLEPERVRTLRLLVTAGSAAHSELVRRWKGRAAYVNAYGPTEATICATVWKADDDVREAQPDGSAEALAAGTVPIGRPVTNSEVYILGPDGQLQPVGAMGELHIGGAGVAMGYLGRAELTAERFVPNPFRPGERMYRSGDYARWLPDGNIAYMGRIDHQVKIRGYRIETGEIENELLRHPAIRQAAVALRDAAAGEEVLFAYYVAPVRLGPAAVKEWLAERLPAYMIPQYAVQLAAMPLTVNGKIDLAALPFGGSGFHAEESGADATATERELSRLWSRALGGGSYGPQTDFFDAGGHSLRAALLIAEIHRRFRVQLTRRELMEASTLRAMAAVIDSLADDGAYEPIPSAGERRSYPLSPAQLRLYVLSRFDPESVAYNLPAVLRVDGALDIGRLRQAFRALIERHEALRTSFALEAGVPVQIVHEAVDVPLAIEDAPFDEEDRDALQAAAERFIRSFDPGAAPLFRVRALRFPSGRHVLLSDIHHLVADGISVSVFVRDLLALYAGAAPKPLPVQYKDYACWQADRLARGALQEQESYWLSRFRSPAPALDGLTDWPRPSAPPPEDGDAVVWTLPEERAAALRDLAASAGATLYMVLLSAYSIMLSRRSGVEDIVVGTPVAGRRHADLQALVGMFINIVPMRTEPRAGLAYRSYLQQVKETVLQGLEHQDYPFDELVSKLGVSRDFGRNPLFDASFALQNMDVARIEADGVAVEPVELRRRPAKFDLTLWAEETEGRGLRLTLEYRTSLFKRETSDRMREDLTAIFARIADDPDCSLDNFELPSGADRREQAAKLARLARELDMEFDL